MRRPKAPPAAEQDLPAEFLAAARRLGSIAGEQRWLDGEPRMDEVMQRVAERPVEGPADRGAREALTWLAVGGAMAARGSDASDLLASAHPLAIAQPTTSSEPVTAPEAVAIREAGDGDSSIGGVQKVRDALPQLAAAGAVDVVVVFADPTASDRTRDIRLLERLSLGLHVVEELLRALAREAGAGDLPVLHFSGHDRTFDWQSLSPCGA